MRAFVQRLHATLVRDCGWSPRIRQPETRGMKRVSKPGRRVYVGSQEAAPIRKGLGIHVLSTPKGILVDREAQRAKVGGELICTVW